MLPSFKEDHISQIPALQLLINTGYKYLTPKEALEERNGKNSGVILEGILEKQLKRINKIEFKGKEYEFSSGNIKNAVSALKDFRNEGLIRTNEKVYDLLCLGKSFEENINGDIKSFNINYIDWKNIHNNIFHVTEEFEVAKTASYETRRPDIVLFVNGIPLAVIECKRPDIKDPLKQAVSQNIRNQREDEIPLLFIYSQIIMAIAKNEAKYGTTGTPTGFWSLWREEEPEELIKLINKPLPENTRKKLFENRYDYYKRYFERLEMEKYHLAKETKGRYITASTDDFNEIYKLLLEKINNTYDIETKSKLNELKEAFDSLKLKGERLVTEQDRLIYFLCRPERLLELTYQFLVYDCGEKKIARYQQYFAVKNTMKRIKEIKDGRREGGVIWHTQGSGKSLTMVMMAKAIALEPSIKNPRIILVTDRIDLDDQIYKTFHQCGKEPVQATSGEDLIKKINSHKEIITTIIDKFRTAGKKRKFKKLSPNIFVLVDESHRSQYGVANATMERVLPNACYIGFTGTPLMKKEKNTARKFGGIIDKYTIDQAVKDKSVLPLLYEGKHVLQEVNQKTLDMWFDRISKGLTEKEKADLKKKFSTADQLNKADQKISMTAYDISEHFSKTWKRTGFKGQLTAPSKSAAIKYKNYMDEFAMITSEVLISPPDAREGYENLYEDPKEEVKKFWSKMMEKFGTEKNYNRQIINSFKNDDHPEIIIVVDKLLTGFDAPRNVVLYITRTLKDHTLLQAIARVNRLYDYKEFGYIIDYYGLLGNLDKALTEYSSLKDFEEKDLMGTITNVMEELKKLPQKHSDLWDIFRTIGKSRDEEKYEVLLENIEIREKFYERLTIFGKLLTIALSTSKYLENTPEKKITEYKKDLNFFLKLRKSVKSRYGDEIDYRDYEPKIQKLIDSYVASPDIIRITEPVNIFDTEKFEEELDKHRSTKSKADTIAYRTIRTIEEKNGRRPGFLY